MIYSMTGYGGASGTCSGLEVTAEVKSVNNRYLDCSVRLPRSLLFAEDSLKSAVQGHISRGKVDVYISVDAAASDDMEIRVNEPLLHSYLNTFADVAERFGVTNDTSIMGLMRIPDLFVVARKEQDKQELADAICALLEQALHEYDAMRAREGQKLLQDVLSRLETIETLVGAVERRSPQTVEEYRARLRQRMDEVLAGAGVEESRILAEAAMYADKVAVNEETVRLRSHIAQMRLMLSGGSPVGKKLDFLVQEFNREANTIGSKCSDSEIARTVIELKGEIEKIREQIQNIE